MKRKDILLRRQKRLEAKKAELVKRSNESQDLAEVRAINEQLMTISEDLLDISDELAALADDGGDDNGDEGANEGGEDSASRGNDEGDDHDKHDRHHRSADPTSIPAAMPQLRGGNPMASYGQGTQIPTMQTRGSYLDTMEYRQAFAEYVQTGKWNYDYEQRDSSAGMVITTDVGKIIPNTIMNEFIKELKVYGQLYTKVRKLNIQGGVEFPIEELVPTVTWITETTVSDPQAVPEIKTSISFSYHIVEARISQSLLSQVVTLDYLESEIAKLLAEAFVKEFDRVIVKGSGSGQPLGILNDTRIAAGHKIKFSAADMADWTKWRTKLFAIIPLAYRGQGELIMTPNTWETYIMTLKDANNNPLYAETYNPVTGDMECTFAGRHVTFVESDILSDYDTASTGDTWCIYLRPQDYAINSQLQIGFKRYFNDDTNKWTNKGLCIMDGKMLDVAGVYLLQK